MIEFEWNSERCECTALEEKEKGLLENEYGAPSEQAFDQTSQLKN